MLPLLMAVLRAGSAHHSLSRGYTAPAHTNSCPSNTNTNTDKYKHSLSFTQSRIHQLTCDHTTICKCSLSQQTEEIRPGVFCRHQNQIQLEIQTHHKSSQYESGRFRNGEVPFTDPRSAKGRGNFTQMIWIICRK